MVSILKTGNGAVVRGSSDFGRAFKQVLQRLMIPFDRLHSLGIQDFFCVSLRSFSLLPGDLANFFNYHPFYSAISWDEIMLVSTNPPVHSQKSTFVNLINPLCKRSVNDFHEPYGSFVLSAGPFSVHTEQAIFRSVT